MRTFNQFDRRYKVQIEKKQKQNNNISDAIEDDELNLKLISTCRTQVETMPNTHTEKKKKAKNISIKELVRFNSRISSGET